MSTIHHEQPAADRHGEHANEHDGAWHPEHAALASGAHALAEEFAGVFDLDTITHVIEDAYDGLADHATTVTYLPVLAERLAHQRLAAMTTSTSSTMTKGPQ